MPRTHPVTRHFSFSLPPLFLDVSVLERFTNLKEAGRLRSRMISISFKFSMPAGFSLFEGGKKGVGVGEGREGNKASSAFQSRSLLNAAKRTLMEFGRHSAALFLAEEKKGSARKKANPKNSVVFSPPPLFTHSRSLLLSLSNITTPQDPRGEARGSHKDGRRRAAPGVCHGGQGACDELIATKKSQPRRR